MILDFSNYNDVVEVDDIGSVDKLGEHEFLLKVHNDVGFMTKLTKKNELPTAFTNWRGSWWSGQSNPVKTYIITEAFRSGWRFVGLRHGTSTAWVILQHPYGFSVEINPSAFEDVVDQLTMVNGVIVTPCYYQAKSKNALLKVEKNNNIDYLYSLISAISNDVEVVEKLKNELEEEFPDKVYSVISPVN